MSNLWALWSNMYYLVNQHISLKNIHIQTIHIVLISTALPFKKSQTCLVLYAFKWELTRAYSMKILHNQVISWLYFCLWFKTCKDTPEVAHLHCPVKRCLEVFVHQRGIGPFLKQGLHMLWTVVEGGPVKSGHSLVKDQTKTHENDTQGIFVT